MIYLQLVNGAAFKMGRAERANIEHEMWVCRDAQDKIILALDRRIVAAYSGLAPPAFQGIEVP
jgi:hypothetical protein